MRKLLLTIFVLLNSVIGFSNESKITLYNKAKTEKLVYEKVEVSLLEKALEGSTYKLKSYTKGKFQILPKEMKNKIIIEGKDGQELIDFSHYILIQHI